MNCAWNAEKTVNCLKLKDIINTIQVNSGMEAGIYSNIYMWQKIIGTQCQDLNPLRIPLWYPHDDKLPNFYDFPTFGIWTSKEAPFTMKQYKLDSSGCDTAGNINFSDTKSA